MKGLKFFKGNIEIEDNDFIMIQNSELLKHELENFILCDPKTCVWDTRCGLDREIIISTNENAIKDEVKNKIKEYFGDRVLELFDIVVKFDKGNVFFSSKMNTIYGKVKIKIGGE